MLPDSYRALRTCAVLSLLTVIISVVLALALARAGAPQLALALLVLMAVLNLLALVRIAWAFDQRSERAREWRTFR